MNTGMKIVIGLFISTYIFYILKKNRMFKKVSKNFYWYEMFVTNTGKDNEPQAHRKKEVEHKLFELANKLLQPVRDLIGKVQVNSAFRNEEVNSDVGGVKSSQHYKAEAADIKPLDMEIDKAFELIKDSKIPYDQIILEEKNGIWWIHISYNPKRNRKQAMIARYDSKARKMNYTYA